MSILIPGFSIPPKGTVRTLVLFDDGMMIDNADGQNQWQAIELPPHGRLGDLDAFLAKLEEDPLFPLVERYGMSGVIEAQPTVIPADPEKEETT